MNIESATVKVCIVDGLEPRKSAVYKRLRRLCGKKVADLMVQEVNIVFKPPDLGVNDHDRTRPMAVGE